jgi:hypothetical protein
MRSPPILFFSGLLLSACSEPTAPAGNGSLAVSVETTGLDFDPDGYRLTVDNIVRASAGATGTMTITRLEPGSHAVGLADLAANCTVQGPPSQTVSITQQETQSLSFAVVCTAASGVIRVVIKATGSPALGAYEVSLDGAGGHPVKPGAPGYLTGVSAGGHSVSLLPPGNCPVEGNARSVTITTGSLIRDTAEVAFAVACVAMPTALRVTVPTTGVVPADSLGLDSRFQVLLWARNPGGYPAVLGQVEANGTLLAPVLPGQYRLELVVPGPCGATVTNPTPVFTVALGSMLDLEIPVQCSSPWDY